MTWYAQGVAAGGEFSSVGVAFPPCAAAAAARVEAGGSDEGAGVGAGGSEGTDAGAGAECTLRGGQA